LAAFAGDRKEEMENKLTTQIVQPPTDLLVNSADALRLRSRAVNGVAGAGSQTELKKVSQEFESLFVAYLLKVMRETIEESGLNEGGLGKSIYTDLFDQELARGIAQHGALGISDLLIKRLSSEELEGPAESDEPKPAGDLQAPASLSSAPGLSSRTTGLESDSDVPDFRMPIQAPVSSRFGMRRDPFTRQLRFHKGLDLAAPTGTKVRAALAGEVLYAGYQPDFGNTVVLQHSDGLLTRYAHLASTDVRKGDFVGTEKVLGSIGNSGRSTGPHLHFEVLRWGEQIDPVGSSAE
jgi:murein DD-endopeptidase MepM/ murein hydrolase activator NlpD